MSKGTLWMGDIEAYMDEAFLKRAFASMGETCLSAKIIANKLTGLPVGYGFLEFGDDDTAQRVLHQCDGKPIPGSNPVKRFKLNHACHGKDQAPMKEYSIFVGDLTPEVDDLALYTAFHRKYPSVRAGKVVQDEQGVSRGYGFVRFSSEDEYHSSLRDMNGYSSLGGKAIRVSIATPKRNLSVSSSITAAASNVTYQPSPSPPPVQTHEQDYSTTYNYQNYDYQDYYNSWQSYQQYYQNYQAYQGYAGYAGYYGQQVEGTQQASYEQYATAQADHQQQRAPLPPPPPPPPPPPKPQEQESQQQQTQQQQTQQQYDFDNEFEDPEFNVDIKMRNKLAVARNEEFYSALDSSRWLPTEGLDPPLVPVT